MALARTHGNIVHRLLPQTRSAWRWLETTLESQRQPCNAALEGRIDRCRKTGRSRTCFDQGRALTECRRGLPEMASVPAAVQRGTLKRPDEAFKGFLRRVKEGGTPGFPRFKGRAFHGSISIVSGVKARDGNLCIPGFGPMAIRRKGGNPCPDGKPVSAVLKRVGGRWQAIVCHAVEIEEPAALRLAIGLDRNAGQVADGDGELHEMPGMGTGSWRRADGCSGSSRGSARPAAGARGRSGTWRRCAARSPAAASTGIIMSAASWRRRPGRSPSRTCMSGP